MKMIKNRQVSLDAQKVDDRHSKISLRLFASSEYSFVDAFHRRVSVMQNASLHPNAAREYKVRNDAKVTGRFGGRARTPARRVWHWDVYLHDIGTGCTHTRLAPRRDNLFRFGAMHLACSPEICASNKRE